MDEQTQLANGKTTWTKTNAKGPYSSRIWTET